MLDIPILVLSTEPQTDVLWKRASKYFRHTPLYAACHGHIAKYETAGVMFRHRRKWRLSRVSIGIHRQGAGTDYEVGSVGKDAWRLARRLAGARRLANSEAQNPGPARLRTRSTIRSNQLGGLHRPDIVVAFVRHGIRNAAGIERGFEIAYGVFDCRLRGEAEFAADFF